MSSKEIGFSKYLSVDKITEATSSYNFSAKPADCKNVAERLGIVSLQNFETKLEVKKLPAFKAILIEGSVNAQVEQACVVSGEPVAEKVDNTFRSYFVATSEQMENLEQADPEFLNEDIEVFEGDNIDMAELATQYLSVFLNSYPKKSDLDISTLNKKGLTIKSEEEMEEELRKGKNPFQQLKSLKTD